jgi:hypothetical protein
MSDSNRKTFFDQWLTQYCDRLHQVCHETMQLLHSEMSGPSLSSPTMNQAKPGATGGSALSN